MSKGQFILPPSITGVEGSARYGNYITDKNKVYVTTDMTAAAMYASVIDSGQVYEVEPIGRLEYDVDCNEPGLSFCCLKAKILKVIKISNNQKNLIISALKAAN